MIMHMRMIVTTNILLAQLIATINPVASHTCTFCNLSADRQVLLII